MNDVDAIASATDGSNSSAPQNQNSSDSCCTCECFFGWIGFGIFHYAIIAVIALLIQFHGTWLGALILCLVYMLGLLFYIRGDFQERSSTAVSTPKRPFVDVDSENVHAESSPDSSTAEKKPEGEGQEDSLAEKKPVIDIADESSSGFSHGAITPPSDKDGILRDSDDMERSFPRHGDKPYSIKLSLLYAFTVLSFGGTMAILVFHLVPCRSLQVSWGDDQDASYWVLNQTLLPSSPELQEWVRETDKRQFPYEDEVESSFCELVDLDEVYFVAHDKDSDKSQSHNHRPHVALYVKRGQEATFRISDETLFDGMPKNYDERDPSNRVEWLTAVKSNSCCFLLASTIWCGNYDAKFLQFENTEQHVYRNMRGINELLWFRYVQQRNINEQRGTAVGSLNLTTGVVKEYSTLYTGPDPYHPNGWNRQRSLEDVGRIWEEDDDYANDVYYTSRKGDVFGMGDEKEEYANCYFYESVSRLRSILGLLLVAVPITSASVWLWSKRSLPSAPLTLYVGIGLILAFLGGLVNNTDGFGAVVYAWCFVGAPVWILVSAFLIALNPRLHKPPLWWIVYSMAIPIALAGVVGATGLILDDLADHSEYYADDMVFPLSSTIVGFLPLAFVGILVESKLLFLLAGVGILVDSIFLALATSGVFSNGYEDAATTWIITAVLISVLLGVFALVFGWMTRNLAMLHNKLMHLLLKCARQVCFVHQNDDGQDLEAEMASTTEHLLTSNDSPQE